MRVLTPHFRDGVPSPNSGAQHLRWTLFEALLCAVVALSGAYFLFQNVVLIPPDAVTVWNGVRDYWSDHSPYLPPRSTSTYNHPPSSATLLGVLAVLPLPAAARALGVLNFLLLLGLPFIVWRFDRFQNEPRRRLPWVLAMTSLALFLGARMGRGNVDVLASSLLLAGILLSDSRRTLCRVSSGIVMGLAAAIKPLAIPAILGLVFIAPIAVPLTALGVWAAATILPLFVFPASYDFFEYVVPYLQQGQSIPSSVDASLGAWVSNTSVWSKPIRVAVGIVLAAVSTVVTLFHKRHHRTDVNIAIVSSSMFLLSALIVAPSAFAYYWIYFAAAAVVTGRTVRTQFLIVAGLLSLALPPFLTSRLAEISILEPVIEIRLLLAFLFLFVLFAVSLGSPRHAQVEASS